MVTKKETPEVDPWDDEQPKNSVTPVVVQTGEGKITVTLKAGAGFEVPWIVRHANTVAEAVEFMQDGQLDELMDLTARKAKEFAKAFGGVAPAAVPKAPSSGGGNWGSKPKAPAGSSEEPVDTCPDHNCPLVKVDSYTKRDGTAVSARYACPVPQCYKKTWWQQKDGSWELKEK